MHLMLLPFALVQLQGIATDLMGNTTRPQPAGSGKPTHSFGHEVFSPRSRGPAVTPS